MQIQKYFYFSLVNLRANLPKQHLKSLQSQIVLRDGCTSEKIIHDGVEASTRKSQARFPIIRVSSSAEPRKRFEKSKNLHEVSSSRPEFHHRFFLSQQGC